VFLSSGRGARRFMFCSALGAALLACQWGSTLAASADDLAQCQREDSLPESRMKSCAALIGDTSLIAEIRAEAYLNRGIAHEELGNIADAIEDYTQAIKLNPEYRILYHYRGLAYDLEGKRDLAIADFSEAIRLDPADTDARVYRGFTYAELGAHEKAIEDFDAVLAIDPNDAIALAGRGESLAALGQNERAIADFRRALEIDPKNEEAAEGLKKLGVPN
jgi:tetratricopeptide (TPR) repeat protein